MVGAVSVSGGVTQYVALSRSLEVQPARVANVFTVVDTATLNGAV